MASLVPGHEVSSNAARSGCSVRGSQRARPDARAFPSTEHVGPNPNHAHDRAALPTQPSQHRMDPRWQWMIPGGHLDDCHNLQNPAQQGPDALASPASLLIRCLRSLSLPLPVRGSCSSPPPAASRVSRNTLSRHHMAKPGGPRRFNDPQASHHPRHPGVGSSSRETASGYPSIRSTLARTRWIDRWPKLAAPA